MKNFEEDLKNLPKLPGVYLMKDEEGNVIYVGKAKSLRSRVRQYFQVSAGHNLKVSVMVSNISSFEYIVTSSELEALILECNLIKKYAPKYNILLKDDKTYPYVKFTVDEAFPRVFLTRMANKDKAKYYGPYNRVALIKDVLFLIHEIWPIRPCSKIISKANPNDRPCLNYHIGKCKAPCVGNISREEYALAVAQVKEFLDGKYTFILNKLEKQMHEHSENLEFEQAADLRNKIFGIKKLAESQVATSAGGEDQDIIAIARANDEALMQVYFIRAGKMVGREHFMLDGVKGFNSDEVMSEFVKRYYGGAPFVPREVVLQTEMADSETITQWLSTVRGKSVLVTIPQKGEKRKLVNLAAQNAQITLERFGDKIRREEAKTKGAVEELEIALNLSGINRIEAYDISNTQGFESVGSMVVFENGVPKRSDYRKFKIKSVAGPNDYASMEEVLTRRFMRAKKEADELMAAGKTIEQGKFTTLPNLIMVDGGAGHVSTALSVLENMGVNIPVCGMVKDDNHKTRGLIYNNNEIVLPKAKNAFKLVTRIQDEVHRFAIEYHRKLRGKTQIKSVLDDIAGVGPARRKALLTAFGSVEEIKKATQEQLIAVEGMDKRTAQAVYDFFQRP